MPRKTKKSKYKPSKVYVNQYGEIFTNTGAVSGTSPKITLNYLIEIFSDRVDKDVIKLVLHECDFNVDQASETLMSLCNDDTGELRESREGLKKNYLLNHSLPASNYNDEFLNSGSEETATFPELLSKSKSLVDISSENFTNRPTTSVQNRFLQMNSEQSSGALISWNSNLASNEASIQEQTLADDCFVSESCSTTLSSMCNSVEMVNAPDSASNLCENFRATTPRFIVPSLPMPGSPSPHKSQGLEGNRGFWSGPDCRHFSTSASAHNKNNNATKEISEKIKNGHRILIILRGLPGSGKSSLALKLKFSGVIFSTDDFFMKNSRYLFDPTRLSEAHEWNKYRTKKALEKGLTPVIIDNTNVEAWEMKPYVVMGKKYSYEIVILEPDTPWKFNVNSLSLRNKHGVQKAKIAKMKERYQKDLTVEKILIATNLFSSNMDYNNSTKTYTKTNTKLKDTGTDNHSVVNNDHVSQCMVENSAEECLSLWGNSQLSVEKVNIGSDNNVNEPKSKESILDTAHWENSSNSQSSAVCDLNALRALVKNDSEDSQSSHSSKNGSLQEISGWEAITEHDNDFHWSTSSKEFKLSSTILRKSRSADNLHLNESTDSSCIEDASNSSYSSSENLSCSIEDNSLTDKSEHICEPLQTGANLHFEEECKIYSEGVHSSNVVTTTDLDSKYSSLYANPNMSDFLLDENSNKPSTMVDNIHDQKLWSEYNEREMAEVINQFSIVDLKENEDFICETLSDFSSKGTLLNIENENEDLNFAPKPPRNNSINMLTINKDHFPNQLLHNKSENTEDDVSNLDWNIVDNQTDEFGENHSKEEVSTPKPQRKILESTAVVEDKTPSKIICKNKKSLLNISPNSIGHVWKFPELVINSPPGPENSRKNSLSFKMSIHSQTEPRDFDFLYKLSFGNDTLNSCGYNIISAKDYIFSHDKLNDSKFIDDLEEYQISEIVTFDKSTSTDDMVDDIEISQKLAHLQVCFPDISKDDLLHLLEICYNDEEWISNLLLEWGYKYNVPAENFDENNGKDESGIIIKSEVDSETYVGGTEVLDWKTMSQFTDCKNSFDSSTDTENVSSSSKSLSEESKEIQSTSEVKIEEPEEKLLLILDPAFSRQLEELFGPVFSSGNRQVEIDLELAKLIHEKWKNTVQQKKGEKSKHPKRKNKRQRQNRDNNRTLVQTLSSPMQTSTEPSTLSEIMDMEYARQLHKEEKLKKDENFRTKMKRSELYNMFPGADTIVLDEIFESNNYSLEKSLKALGTDISQEETVEKKETVAKFDARVKQWEKANIFREFESGDFSGWVYQCDNMGSVQETAMPVASPTISTEARELRATAAQHFQLRQEYIQKAQAAYCRGMKDVASFYAQQGSEEGRIAKQTNKLAAKLIADEKNSLHSSFKLDLHGLHVQEAISVLDKFLCVKKLELQQRQHSSPIVVSIITGQGLHSLQGAKLRPAVLTFLKRSHYSFSEIKTGVIEVTVVLE